MENVVVVLFRRDGSIERLIGPMKEDTARMIVDGANKAYDFNRASAYTLHKP